MADTTRLAELWRYPVKSMGGERVATRLVVGDGPGRGLPGDRAWAVRDETRAALTDAKKLGELMRCSAAYPGGDEAQAPVVTLPDGAAVAADAPDAAATVSAALGRPVTLWPLQPSHDLDHYRRGAPDHDDPYEEARAIFGLLPDEPLPDLRVLDRDVRKLLREFETPPGTYFDAYPLLLLTAASLAALAEAAPDSAIDLRRFRPNLVLDDGPAAAGNGFAEASWLGRRLRIGEAVLRVASPCPRCVMATRATAELAEDRTIMRALVKHTGQMLGAYAVVEAPGSIGEGDRVELE
ncbi:MAG: MOSC domain-containing protein [Acidimicrobiales bacterium]